VILPLNDSKERKQRENMTMKKNNIDTFLIELEKNNETFKKWGDLYRIEENIIKTIISTRKKKGLTQKEVAEMTGLKQPTIARIENNVNSPQLDTLIKILDALDLKIEINSLKTDKILVDKTL
jgi:DNA-binding XRE family transcriptional regulator